MKKLLLFFILTISFSSVFAGTIDYTFVEVVVVKAQEWVVPLSRYTLKIFTILFFFDTMIQALTNELFKVGKIADLLRFVTVRALFFGVFSGILMNPDFYFGIPQYFAKIAKDTLPSLAHVNNSPSNVTGIDAGWIWGQYAKWFENDYTPAILRIGGVSGMNEFPLQLSMAFGSLIYMLSCIVISFLAIMLNVQIVLIAYGGLILTGFAGSNWTRKWWSNYLGACVGLGVKVLIFSFLYATLESVLSYKSGNINNSIDVWTQIISTILCTLMLAIIPTKISSLVSSVASTNLGGEVIGAAFAGFALAKGGFVGGVNSIKGVASVSSKAANFGRNVAEKIGNVVGNNNAGSSKQPMADKKDKEKFLKNDFGLLTNEPVKSKGGNKDINTNGNDNGRNT